MVRMFLFTTKKCKIFVLYYEMSNNLIINSNDNRHYSGSLLTEFIAIMKFQGGKAGIELKTGVQAIVC